LFVDEVNSSMNESRVRLHAAVPAGKWFKLKAARVDALEARDSRRFEERATGREV
jgi:hypothetical protein